MCVCMCMRACLPLCVYLSVSVCICVCTYEREREGEKRVNSMLVNLGVMPESSPYFPVKESKLPPLLLASLSCNSDPGHETPLFRRQDISGWDQY